MTNLLRLRGADGSIADFEDGDSVEWFKFMGPPSPQFDRQITALGCGAAPGATASLNTDRYISVTRKYQIGFWDAGRSHLNGASFAQIEVSVRKFEHMMLRAKWHALDSTNPTVEDADGNSVTACAVWLERQLYDQPRPEIWTVLTGTEGKTGRIYEERYGIPRITLELELVCMEGAVSLGPDGFPIGPEPGGTARAFAVFPPHPAIVYGGTVTITPNVF